MTFEAKEGETLCLIGPSGSGKSTILKLINGLLKPDSGKIEVLGSDVASADGVQLRRHIGFVLQQAALFPHYTVKQNMEVVPKLLGWKEDKCAARTAELLQLMALNSNDLMDRYPSQLSGGQQQRVAIARALAADPDLILFDEPFSALDPITRSDLQDEVLRLKQTLHKTAVFVTHDIQEAFKLGDTIVILNEGRVVQKGTPQEIQARPADAFVERFIDRTNA
ncbi:ATP-binding cassette domain-containing protein [Cryomorphaceae bacterium 1068]|nr:ATP-binding cassette domain-containing protein [Cryomorphaceae bacterium 1068]